MNIHLASGNAHKLREFGDLMIRSRLFHNIIPPLASGGMPAVDENGQTFEDNAALKAAALLPLIPNGEWVLADDSGLEVDALGGAPGLHSARYAGKGAGDAANLEKLLNELRGVPAAARSARFVCVLYFAMAGSSEPRVFRGECRGRILEQPCGDQGFGYDPVFVPCGHSESFASMPLEKKQQLSHRAKATAQWLDFLRRL